MVKSSQNTIEKIVNKDSISDNKRYRSLIEASPNGIATVSKIGIVTFCNPTFLKLTGYSEGEIVGKHISKLPTIRKKDIPKYLKLLVSIFKGSKLKEEEFVYITKSKKIRFGKAIIGLVKKEGKVSELMLILRDIKDEKNSKKALEEAERKYKDLVENLPEIILEIDPKGKIVYANKRAFSQIGYSRKDLKKGLNIFQMVDRKDQKKLKKNFIKLLDGKKVGRQLYTIKRNNKIAFTALAHTSIIKNKRGEITGFRVIVVDMVEQINIENKLKESERRHVEAQNIAHLGHFDLDFRTNKVILSDELYRMFKLKPKDFNNDFASIVKMFHPEDKVFVQNNLFGLINNNSLLDFEHRMILNDKEKSQIYVRVRSKRYYNKSGKPETMVGTVQDITEKKKIEQNIESERNKFKSLIDGLTYAGIGIDIVGLDHKIYYQNNLLEDTFGKLSSEEICYKKYKGFEKPCEECNIEEAIKEKRPFSREERGSDNKIYNVLSAPIPFYDGKEDKVIEVITDITEKKNAEESISKSERNLRQAQRVAQIGHWELELINNELFWSDEIYRIFEIDSKKFGATYDAFLNAIHPEDRDFVDKAYSDSVKNKTSYDIVHRLLFKGGRIKYVNEKCKTVYDKKGNPVRSLGTVQDITKRIKAENELKKSYNKTEKALSGTIKTLATIGETRDPYTSGHQKRVAELAKTMSLELGLDKNKVEAVHTAALIHDIGKINVPASILAKPGKITDLEFNMIKTHSTDGYKILKKIEFQWPLARIVLQHHERENGSGYPEGLKNKKIMLEAKIIAVADVVEAMSSHRPYRPTLGVDKALREIKKNKGKLYDPKVVDACIGLFKNKGFRFTT